jgi:phosphoglycolate phosphatase-like HAD superfamily hydrolase
VRLLALDFDGVISDSAPESFQVALRTWRELHPETTADDSLYARFLEMMPLGNRAEDYAVELAALDAGRMLHDQEEYDAFKRECDPDELRRFHKHFYRVRADLFRADPTAWHALMRPYAALLEILRRRASDVELAVATAKDRGSVRRLLEAYGVSDLFGEGRVLDKDTGVSKTAHMERLSADLDIPLDEITFVDDKLNHLDSVSPLGVRCALAAWGYNGPREHLVARRSGHLVCTLEDVESTLFATTP